MVIEGGAANIGQTMKDALAI